MRRACSPSCCFFRSMLPVVSRCGGPCRRLLPLSPARTAKVNGISLYYATIGHGSPVVLLHGGLANSDYWGNQIKALAPRHTVIVVDSRGHGRSTRDARPYGYDLMADDVVALLDTLHIAKADVVGWSDGAILGLDLAIRHPDRVGKVFAFAANTVTSGAQEGVEKNPTFAAFIERAGHEPIGVRVKVFAVGNLNAGPETHHRSPRPVRRVRACPTLGSTRPIPPCTELAGIMLGSPLRRAEPQPENTRAERPATGTYGRSRIPNTCQNRPQSENLIETLGSNCIQDFC